MKNIKHQKSKLYGEKDFSINCQSLALGIIRRLKQALGTFWTGIGSSKSCCYTDHFHLHGILRQLDSNPMEIFSYLTKITWIGFPSTISFYCSVIVDEWYQVSTVLCRNILTELRFVGISELSANVT